MIGYVRGIVTHLFKESCYVDVHGVGYRVYVPTTTRQQLIEGHEATLFTYLNVREDAMQLYGFWTVLRARHGNRADRSPVCHGHRSGGSGHCAFHHHCGVPAVQIC